MKRCSKCGEEKPLPGFTADRTKRDGLRTVCRACDAVTKAEWARVNKDKLNADHRRYRQEHPEKNREWGARYRAKHPVRCAAASKRKRLANPARACQRTIKWQRANPQKRAATEAARRARIVLAPGRGISAADMQRILSATDGRCAYCGERTKLSLDHIEPLARGGAHDPDNAVAACKPCNSSKNDSPLLVWLARKGAA